MGLTTQAFGFHTIFLYFGRKSKVNFLAIQVISSPNRYFLLNLNMAQNYFSHFKNQFEVEQITEARLLQMSDFPCSAYFYRFFFAASTALSMSPYVASYAFWTEGQGDSIPSAIPRPHPQQSRASDLLHTRQDCLVHQTVPGRDGFPGGGDTHDEYDCWWSYS